MGLARPAEAGPAAAALKGASVPSGASERACRFEAGLGVVVAHPESTVRGLTRDEALGGSFGGSCYVTGVVAALGLARAVRALAGIDSAF